VFLAFRPSVPCSARQVPHLRYAAVSALAVVFSLAACGSPPTAIDDDIRVEFSVSQTELLVPGDSLVMRVSVRTASRWPRELPQTEGCRDGFEVRNAAGESLRRVLTTCQSGWYSRSPIMISRANPHEYVMVWRGELGFEPGTWVAIQAPPGVYYLSAPVADGLESARVAVRVCSPMVGSGANR